MTEFHEIGTPPDEWTFVVDSKNGFLYNVNGWSSESIFSAALDGNLSLLQSHYSGDVLVVPSSGLSVMHYAVAGNQFAVVVFLLDRMKRPHAPDKAGTSPLSLACRYGHLPIVNLLCERGGLVASLDRRGNTCLHEASKMGQYHVIEYLLKLIEKYKILLGHLIWAKNAFGQTCRDIAESDDIKSILLKHL